VSSLSPRLRGALPLTVVGVGLLVQILTLARHARTLWFFGDDWDFLLQRSLRDPVGLFEPHNEHWSTLPIIAFRLVHAVWGIDSYLPYAMLPILAHAVVVVALYLTLRRAGLTAWVAAITVTVTGFLASGAGAENTLWDFQIGFVGACALGIIALFFAMGGTRRDTVLAVLALILALMTAGTALQMTAWVWLSVLFLRGLRASLEVAVPPAVLYVVWYLAFGGDTAEASPTDWSTAPGIFMAGINHVWGLALGVESAGLLVLVLLAAPLLDRTVPAAPWALAAAGLGALLLAFMLFTYIRASVGPEATLAYRYVYFGIVFSTPALALLLALVGARLTQAAWLAPASAAVVCAAAVGLGLAHASTFAAGRLDLIESRRDALAAGLKVATSGQRLLAQVPEPINSRDVSTDDVRGPLRPLLKGREVDDVTLLTARRNLQVRVSAEDAGLPAPPAVNWTDFDGVAPGAGSLLGCQTHTAVPGAVTARVEFSIPPSGAQVTVSTTSESPTTQLAKPGLQTDQRPVADWEPGTERVLAATATGSVVRLFAPEGTLTVCAGR
jgi:hypothetical protein